MWTSGVLIALFNAIFAISALLIFIVNGRTISLKDVSFDTSKNYSGEGLTIILWTILYIIVASYFSYETMVSYLKFPYCITSALGVKFLSFLRLRQLNVLTFQIYIS